MSDSALFHFRRIFTAPAVAGASENNAELGSLISGYYCTCPESEFHSSCFFDYHANSSWDRTICMRTLDMFIYWITIPQKKTWTKTNNIVLSSASICIHRQLQRAISKLGSLRMCPGNHMPQVCARTPPKGSSECSKQSFHRISLRQEPACSLGEFCYLLFSRARKKV
jgi:hypothetical protein